MLGGGTLEMPGWVTGAADGSSVAAEGCSAQTWSPIEPIGTVLVLCSCLLLSSFHGLDHQFV